MLTESQIKNTAIEIIRKIAPEADIVNLDPEMRFRDQFDFDSVDFMNFAMSLQSQLKVDISEEDYPQLATLKGCISYVKSKSSGSDVVGRP
jgi:acyl carrier protein